MSPRITLFFCPSYPTRVSALGHAPPLSLAYLAQALQQAGFFPLAINGNEHVELPEELGSAAYERSTVDRMVKLVSGTTPDILVIAAWTYALPFTAEFTKSYKHRHPECLILLGGINATHLPDDTLRLLPAVDLLVRSEGQQALVEIAKGWKPGSTPADFSQVQGVSFRKEGRAVHIPNGPVLQNLDTLPLLDFSAFEHFDGRERKNFYLLTSLGCPYTCQFCSNPGIWTGYRKYSVAYMVKQLRLLEQKYGDIQMSFWDSDFTLDQQRAISLSNAFAAEGFRHQWFCYARVDEVSKQLTTAMKAGGCRYMFFGLESTNPQVLQWYQKAKSIPAYLKSVPKALEHCTESRISAILSVILGAPVENAEEMRKVAADALALKQQNSCVDQLEVGMLTLEIGAALWNRYRAGEIQVRQVQDEALCESYSGYQYFAKQYAQEFSFAPQRHAVVHPTLSQEEYERTLLEIARGLDREGVL